MVGEIDRGGLDRGGKEIERGGGKKRGGTEGEKEREKVRERERASGGERERDGETYYHSYLNHTHTIDPLIIISVLTDMGLSLVSADTVSWRSG